MSHLPTERYGTTTRAQARAQERRRGFGRFLGMTLLGTVLPGAGLLLSDRRKSGGTLLTLFVLVVLGTAAYFWVRGPQLGALSLAVDSDRLLVVAACAVTAVVVLVASIVWTAVLNWPSRPATGRRVLATLVTTIVCVALLAPTARAVQYVFIQRDVLGSVFNAVAPGDGTGPDLSKPDAWSDVPRINVLLVGGDSGPDRVGLRTDSMMLASIDTRTGDTVLFGLPRNLENAPFPAGSPLASLYPNGFRCPHDCLLNDVWMQGETHKDLYPGDPKPGVTALNEAVTGVTGITPDYDVVINMASFTALVDAMGGVDINVKSRVPIGGKVENGHIVPGSIHGWIEPGPQHLDGYHAMWYSRGRATTDDFDRMRRQRCMVGALVKQVNPALMLERYPQIAKVAKDNIYTNIPQSHLAAWAELATRMQSGTIRSLPFSNKIVNVGDPDYAAIHRMVQAAIDGEDLSTVTASPGSPSGSGTTDPTRPPTAPVPTRTSSTSPQPTPTGSGTPTPADGLVKVTDAC